MITLPTTVVNALASGSRISSFTTIEIPTLNYYASNLDFNITLGGHVYSAEFPILNIVLPSIDSSVDSTTFNLKVAYGAIAPDTAIGHTVTMRTGFIINDVMDYDIANTVTNYKGRIDTVNREITFDSIGVDTLDFSLSSPMSNLDLVLALYTNKETMTSKLAVNDTCFDSVYTGSDRVTLNWGKI
jgi:hypothetical protein